VPDQRGCLREVERFAGRKPIHDVDQIDLVGDAALNEALGGGCSYVSGSNDGDFHGFAPIRESRAAERGNARSTM
jgi:hypothetical protein